MRLAAACANVLWLACGWPLGAAMTDLEAGVPCIIEVREEPSAPRSCWRRLWEYWNQPWRWTVREGGTRLQGGEGGLFRSLGGGRVLYTPPRTDRVRTLVLQITSRYDPALTAKTAFRVLPAAPLDVTGLTPDVADIVRGYCPEVDRAPNSAPLPYLDLATGTRPQANIREALVQGTIAQDWRHRSNESRVLAGYGIPTRLAWATVPRAAGQLLSYRTRYPGSGADIIRMDVTGRTAIDLTFTEAVSACTLEILVPNRESAESWTSVTRRGRILVRGLLPLAGNPVAEAGPADPALQDGQGVSARFDAPAGVALVARDTCACGESHPALVVAEPQAHVLRSVGCRGEVQTLWGHPGHPGYRDGIRSQARFNGPTHLAHWEGAAWDPDEERYVVKLSRQCLVSDSGNHVIRQVWKDGRVTTLAGTRGPGYRDGPELLLARFNNPQGIAVDVAGNVYVADQGNHVIRKISSAEGVTTLAGSAGSPGAADGLGAEARFHQLKGMAWDRLNQDLYVADGHAIRRVTPDGQVTTVLGTVTQAGFQDDLTGTAGQLGTPCLNDPWALVAGPDVLYIADRGNHAIRECSLPALTLRTLAGSPDRPVIRWGLLRDGLEVFPEEGYATLLAPRGIAGDFRTRGEETLAVATGPCLAQIPGATQPVAARPRVELQPTGPVAAGEDYEVAFTVPNDRDGEAESEATFDFEYTVAFLDPDGTPAGPPAKGRGRFATPLRVQGQPFSQPGHGRIQVRCVTADGISGDAGRAVAVR